MKHQQQQMLARMWGKRNPHILWVGMEISGTIMIAAWRFLEKLKIELPYDPAIPLLGMYSKE
jgi:hypothetical protein